MVPRTLPLLPRFYLGLVFAVAAYGKAMAPSGFPSVLAGFLGGAGAPHSFPWYGLFLHAVVLPHAAAFAYLIIAGEAFVAIGMILGGLGTRLAAFVAIFLLLNYASLKGMAPWSPASNDWADIVLALVVAIGAYKSNSKRSKTIEAPHPS